MDPERHREISRRGGEASHGGQGRYWEESSSRGRGSSRYEPRYETEERDTRGRFMSSGHSSRYENDDERSSSRRGFAAMDPEERREFGRMGARARWGYGDGGSSRYGDGGSSRYGDGGSSRYGFEGRGYRSDDDDRRYGESRRSSLGEYGPAEGRGGWDYDDEERLGRGYGRGSRYEDEDRDSRGRFMSSGRSSPYYADEDDRSSGRYDWSSPYERERFGGTTSRSWRSYE